MKLKLFLLTCILGSATALFAQPSYYQISGLGAYTIPNSDEYGYIASFSGGVAFDVAWNFNRGERWFQLRPDSQFGIRASFLCFDNPIAGHRYVVEGTMRNTLLHFPKTKLQWLLNCGFSCFTNPYKRSGDQENIFIGSYLNCMIDVGMDCQIGLRNGDVLSLALMLSHSSNGYILKPNQGLNLMQVEVGYQFSTAVDAPDRSDMACVDFERFAHSHFFLSASPAFVKARYPFVDDPYYFAYTLQTGYLYAFSAHRMAGASLDFMYNFSHSDIARSKGVDVPTPLYLGACADYETYWGPFSIRLAMGCYLHKSELESIPVYERVGAYYHFGKSLRQFAGISLKAHYAHVDYIEWTYGIEL
ncbi:MAG: acyloxyacyl hydrolase [Bacteroidales bacterium]|nr:acyloxyacyl hydrolase [Candidatus Colimorpha pelethequi]